MALLRQAPSKRRASRARDGEGAGTRAQDRHHALVVGRDHELGLSVAVEAAHLGVAHAAHLAAEVLDDEVRKKICWEKLKK